MSEEAYDELGLPADMITPNEPKDKPAEFQEAKVLPDQLLIETVEEELGDEYITDMLASPTAEFAAADKRFAEGRSANDTGDQFSLVQVYFTISLFFAGLGLVFKTGIRWGFFSAGLLVFLYSTAFLFRIPWA